MPLRYKTRLLDNFRAAISITSALSVFFTQTLAYALPVNVELLQLLPGASTGTGNLGDNALRGNASANVLRGLAGARFDAELVACFESIVDDPDDATPPFPLMDYNRATS